MTNLYFRPTALLLIVYVNRGEFLTEAIVKWLNSQRLSLSGWGSTIDTILATEALALWAAKHSQEFNNTEGGLAIKVHTQQGCQNIVVAEAKAFKDELNNLISPTQCIDVKAKGLSLVSHGQSLHRVINLDISTAQGLTKFTISEPFFLNLKIRAHLLQDNNSVTSSEFNTRL